ncbi:hypothetical protein [Kiloniella litopenaei]|uniref:hypothetical protein n=1 Tax=Kiloniella litopenaei TaxID=1549748 RepID=UPI0012FF0D96|nr:hypothetical protein [Kiloniella litopenaei]
MPEIYGRTSFTTKLEATFLEQGISVTTLDPYDGQQPVFDDEQHAYDFFIRVCGHDGYLSLLQKTFRETVGPLFLLGFSVGASTVWRMLDHPDLAKRVQHFVGFYPSQIRHYLSINPECPVSLVFPKEETHFSVQDVMIALGEKDFVTCFQSSGLHGFLNPCSPNYVFDLSSSFLGAFQSFDFADLNCADLNNRLDACLLNALE